MSPIIRRMLWGAFIGLAILTAGSVALTIGVLQMEQRREYVIVQEGRPLLDSVRMMDESLATMVSAARGYVLTGQTAFEQQYEDAMREYGTAEALAMERVSDSRDREAITKFRDHYKAVKALTDKQIKDYDNSDGKAATVREAVVDVAKLRRSAPDYESIISQRIRNEQAESFDEITTIRQWVMMAMVFVGLGIIVAGAIAANRIEDQLVHSLNRQVRRTEAMIAGMAASVLLVDGEGRTVFINPSGQRLLGTAEVGVPITKHAEAYRLRDEHGRKLDPQGLPAAQALSTGRVVHDVTILITRDESVAVSMSATPLHEDGQTSGVVVTVRDLTERGALDAQQQVNDG